MTERYSVCMPLGFGIQREPTTIRWDGVDYRCIPFRVEVGGGRIVERSPSSFSLVDNGGLSEVMVHADHPLAQGFRGLVSRERAEQLVELLTGPGEPDAVSPGPSLLADAARLCASAEPEPICRWLSGVTRSSRQLSFGEQKAAQALTRVTLAELAHVLDTSSSALAARLGESGGELWRRIAF